ncbi:MAG: hypothetical protein ACREQK_03275, partial [Candidatus Binatia bacterium]
IGQLNSNVNAGEPMRNEVLYVGCDSSFMGASIPRSLGDPARNLSRTAPEVFPVLAWDRDQQVVIALAIEAVDVQNNLGLHPQWDLEIDSRAPAVSFSMRSLRT